MKLGLNKHTILWIQSFLENRRQTVVADGQKSTSVPVKSGVPQGLVLGPCIFTYLTQSKAVLDYSLMTQLYILSLIQKMNVINYKLIS